MIPQLILSVDDTDLTVRLGSRYPTIAIAMPCRASRRHSLPRPTLSLAKIVYAMLRRAMPRRPNAVAKPQHNVKDMDDDVKIN